MKPGGGRNKGAQFERDVVNLALDLGFKDAHRTAPMQAGHPKRYADIGGIPMLWLECKREKKVRIHEYARTSLTERPGFIPVIAHQNDREQPLATLPLVEFLKLLRRAYPEVSLDEVSADLERITRDLKTGW